MAAAELNFARRPFRDYRAVDATITVAAVLGLLMFALNLRDFFAFRQGAASRRSEIQQLERMADDTEQRAASSRTIVASMRLRDLQVESLTLNALVKERRFDWMRLLSDLEHVVPEDVYVTRLSPNVLPDGSVTLHLSFVGRGPESIVHTLRALGKSTAFSNPVPQSETDPEKGAPEGFQFHIQVGYKPGVGA